MNRGSGPVGANSSVTLTFSQSLSQKSVLFRSADAYIRELSEKTQGTFARMWASALLFYYFRNSL